MLYNHVGGGGLSSTLTSVQHPLKIYLERYEQYTLYIEVYEQNRQLSFLVKRDTKIVNLKVKAHEKRNPFHKIKITNTDEKERVEC